MADIYVEEAGEGSGMGLCLIGGPFAEYSAAKLKRVQLNIPG